MSSTPSSGSPDYEQLLSLYQTIVTEYRFQVQLNWDRAKYFMGFNTAVFGVGVGLLKLGGSLRQLLVAGVFAIGLVGCLLAGTAVRTQHEYYATVRDQMATAADTLNLGPMSVSTTPGAQRRRRSRWQSFALVQSMIFAVLGVTAIADILAITDVLAEV